MKKSVQLAQVGHSFYIKKLPAFQGEEHIVRLNSY